MIPTRVISVSLFAAGWLVLSAPATPAQELCSRPIQPLCSTAMSTAITDADRMRCIEDVKRFHESFVEYRECLRGSVAEADRRVDQVAGMITCMEEGRNDCGAETEN